ncbi:uncharacterized protein DUF1446 [Amycolatopsis sulphurea]|uniref:Uncharacterized protein DUF1446 n=2 Tax=Amycolatopsis sulphurea TaxID=76022 RepID=A0A2A9G3M7_9PSEU|nr:uncharacterized protein DUF1446 [Amycolatopsis sulphurea]
MSAIHASYEPKSVEFERRCDANDDGEFGKTSSISGGSSGGAGRDHGVDRLGEMVEEYAARHGQSLKVVKVYAEVDPAWVQAKLDQGRVHALHPRLPYDADTPARSLRIVAMMGVEAFQHALDLGADVVLAGRASDAAIFASIPISRGFPEASSWHAGKTADCGAVAATPPKLDCVHVRVDESGFEIEPMAERLRCTPESVASQQLYESADPFHLAQPSGMLDTTDAQYVAVSDRAVRGSGASWTPSEQHTVKIEGVEFIGHRKGFVQSIRDPAIVEHFDEWFEDAMAVAFDRIRQEQGESVLDQCHVRVHPYGVSGTMGGWEFAPPTAGTEVALLAEVTAPDAELAGTVANILWYNLLHHPTKYAMGYVTLGVPYQRPIMDHGPVYAFNTNHIVEVDDPLEPFRFIVEEVSGR